MQCIMGFFSRFIENNKSSNNKYPTAEIALDDEDNDFKPNQDKVTIYVLELSDGKYYVGKTTNMTKRYSQHASGTGSRWTQRYPPKRILEQRIVRSAESDFQENMITKLMMRRYGIDNVRGGMYSYIRIPDGIRDVLAQELRLTSDACFRCGREGHYTRECYAVKDARGRFIND